MKDAFCLTDRGILTRLAAWCKPTSASFVALVGSLLPGGDFSPHPLCGGDRFKVVQSLNQGWVGAISLLLTALTLTTSSIAKPGPTDSQSLTAELQTAVTAYVIQEMGLPENDLLLEIGQPRTGLDPGMQWDQIRILPGRRPVSKGLQLLRCGVFLNDQLQQSVDVTVRVRTFQDVVASDALLGRHETILQEHLTISRRETTKLRKPAYTKVEDVVGMRAKMVIRTGQIITENFVEAQPLIRSGSRVKIYFISKGLQVTMPGIVRQDGFANGTVRVKCLETKRSYTAEVRDAHSVVVYF